jgi:hypothetical protein
MAPSRFFKAILAVAVLTTGSAFSFSRYVIFWPRPFLTLRENRAIQQPRSRYLYLVTQSRPTSGGIPCCY